MTDRLKFWLTALQKKYKDNHIAEVICGRENDFEIPSWIGHVVTGNAIYPFDRDENKELKE